MRFSLKINRLFALLLLTLITTPLAFAVPDAKDEGKKTAKPLPSRFGAQVAVFGKPQPLQIISNDEERANFLVTGGSQRTYRTSDGNSLAIEVVQTRTSAAAYALLTVAAERMRRETGTAALSVIDEVGTYAFSTGKRVLFFRGANFVHVEAITEDKGEANYSYVTQAAKEFDSFLLKEGSSDEDIPVLAKHLPAWEQAQQQAMYAVSLSGLQEIIGAQPILQNYDFSGGTEAVVAPYLSASGSPVRLVIIEHFTPQLAADNERLISARASELRVSGATVPQYRRVGNYLVFAFDASTELAANELIGKVKYEQDVRWLGDNPFAQERANRAYVAMSLGVLIGSLKSAGIGMLLCLGVGTVVGGIVFMRRRAQFLAAATYTDAGGMIRLGIDKLTTEEDSARMISSGKN